jgi:hypothetical protein
VNDIGDWILVGAAVLAATAYLAVHWGRKLRATLRAPRGSKGCAGCPGDCRGPHVHRE